jgi:hypothetical protein
LSADAQPVRGPAVPYEPVKITSGEKNAWADAIAANGIRIEVENGQRRVGRTPRPDIETQEWPDVMPPFLAQAAMATADGRLVVARATAADAPERVYDVFDESGTLVHQIITSGDRRVVGFGNGTAYVVRVDDDDLEWLEVYRL